MTTRWLYRCEFKGIQRWILDSGLLRDLAGGSALVERLIEEGQAGVAAAGGEIVQAAAGGLLAEFPSRTALEAFAAEWPMYAAHRAPGLPLVQGWVEMKEDKTSEAANRLFQEVLPSRRNLPPPPPFEPGPWVDRSGRSGLPAVPPPGDLPERKARAAQWDEPSVARERVLAQTGGEGRVFGGLLRIRDVVEDLDKWPAEPVAVLHADGSGVGARITGLPAGLPSHRSFSDALSEATRAATRAAVEHLRESSSRDGDRDVWIRPVVLGGDDLTAIVLGRYALGFLRRWLEAFEAETGARSGALGGKKLCAGAGLALVNRDFPFRTAYEVAERLCGGAKKRHGPDTSVLQMRRITNALDDVPTVAGPTRGLDDAARAGIVWTLDRLPALERLVAAAARLPRGTLRGWLSLVDQGPQRQAERNALWRRAGEVAAPREWAELRTALEAAGADPDTGFSRDDGKPADSPLRDALALGHLERRAAARRPARKEGPR